MSTLIVYTHGIGSFDEESVRAGDNLLAMETVFRMALPNEKVQVRYIAYEDLLDKKATSKAVQLAAAAASMYYTGSPIIGRMLADHGTDILQYYLQRKTTRHRITRHYINMLAMLIMQERPKKLILMGHSLGSIVVLNALATLQDLSKGYTESFDGLEINDDFYHTYQWIKGKPIVPVLLGSPAFSRLKGVKFATNRLALRKNDIEQINKEQVAMHGTPVFNLYSSSFLRDPISGKAPKGFINIRCKKDKVVHHGDELGYFDAFFTADKAKELFQ